MPKVRVPPRQRLAKNLKALMAMQNLSARQVSEVAKVSNKTVSNMVNASFDPRLSLVEKVANVFGMTAWQLLAADLEARPKEDSAQAMKLLEHYTNAQDDGRKAIMHVAEMAASKG